jgi:Rieske 2Fe-2S family protein
VHPDAVAGRDFDPDNVKALWHVTIQEDNWITANNHEGIRSGAYGSGRYSGSELSLVNFMDWYMDTVVPAG